MHSALQLDLTPSIPIDSSTKLHSGKLSTAENRPSGDGDEFLKGAIGWGQMKGKIIGHVLGIVILAAGIASHGAHARQQVQEKNSKPDRADIQPVRVIADPYPTFNGIAVDPSNNIVAMTDPNRKSLLSYDSRQGSNHGAANIPIHQVSGPNTFLGMIAGMVLDGQHHEIYAANNDIEDTVVVMPYEAMGDAEPARVFSVPHQSWGLALSHKSDEIAVTVEVQNTIVFYRREVKGVEAPTRLIRGVNTGLADPHGGSPRNLLGRNT